MLPTTAGYRLFALLCIAAVAVAACGGPSTKPDRDRNAAPSDAAPAELAEGVEAPETVAVDDGDTSVVDADPQNDLGEEDGHQPVERSPAEPVRGQAIAASDGALAESSTEPETDATADNDAAPAPVADTESDVVGESDSAEAAPDLETATAGQVVQLGGERPARLRVPPSYVASTPMPLVILLHGYTATSRWQDAYFGLSRRAEVDGLLLLLPEGRRDTRGQQFWNATDACCDLFGAGGDDASYLVGLIEEAKQRVAVDGDRVWVIGHSNGGFMAYRLACDGAPISAIVSLAGSEWADQSICDGAPPLHVLQIHGDQDAVVPYQGVASLGPGLGGFPSADVVVERWARRGGCELRPEEGERRDLDGRLPDSDSDVLLYAVGCSEGASAELWTIRGGAHVPPLGADFSEQIVGWLMTR